MSMLKGLLLGGCTDGWWSAEATGQMTAGPSCGKRAVIMRAADEKAFEERGHDPAV